MHDRASGDLGHDEGEGEDDAEKQEHSLLRTFFVVAAGVLVPAGGQAQYHVGQNGESDAHGADKENGHVLESHLVRKSRVGAVFAPVQTHYPAPRP